MAVFDHVEFANHERVIFCSDAPSGLRAIIAIHDRTLGPAVGGCRLYPYPNEQAALSDVLRLSQGMTYKNALAGLPFGGAKSVIIAEPSAKTPALLRAFAENVERLGGQYWTGEDVNIGTADIEVFAQTTSYLLGRTKGEVSSGDPSPFTAAGCFEGMRAALQHVFGTDTLSGRRVAIQGVGSVGLNLAKLVSEAGGNVIVTDVRDEQSKRAQDATGATIVSSEAIYEQDCDVFAPCALGATINDQTLAKLKAKIICGAANNQLATPAIGEALLQRGVTYAPDYVVNAGGMLNACGDFFGRYDINEVRRSIAGIRETVASILATAAAEARSPHEVADAMAQSIIDRRRAAN